MVSPFSVCRDATSVARRETALSRRARNAGHEGLKKGVHGGNMVSPVLNRPDWVGIPVAAILRLIDPAAAPS
jgi:hypothetical protein